jgi:hypothetical protein
MSAPVPATAPIVCSATSWFLWQRVVPFSLLPLLMAAWFYYDYKVGFPEKLMKYEKKLEFEKAGKTEEWVAYSHERGWDKKPEEMDQRKVDEQFYWAMGVGILGIVSSAYHLLSYPKKLRADETSFTPPWGPQIPFHTVQKIDRRPWKLKGLAKVYYQLEKSGPTKKASLDDLRFKGADEVLARLQANFSGEILDHEETEPTPPIPAEVATVSETQLNG